MNGLRQFGLTLVVNHACNLRCSYCHTGAKFHAPMDHVIGVTAMERAFRSLLPEGQLNVGFFGGEPLLESARILAWMSHARASASHSGKGVRFNVTTNGTISHPAAWEVMMAEDLDVAVSFDGNPEMHDRHRRDAQNQGSAGVVAATVRRLLMAGKSPCVVVVVRPDGLAFVPQGLGYLRDMGVREVHLSLDLWTTWTLADGRRLSEMVERIAELWRDWLPDFSLNWFDAKAAQLAGLGVQGNSTRCGFGAGEIAVAPSGTLYPCERLVGEDRPGNPLRLPGHALAGIDFLDYAPLHEPPRVSQVGRVAPRAPSKEGSWPQLTSILEVRPSDEPVPRRGPLRRPSGGAGGFDVTQALSKPGEVEQPQFMAPIRAHQQAELTQGRRCEPCSKCALLDSCDTACRCSNYIRTGDGNRPDGLLCLLSKAVTGATVRALGFEPTITPGAVNERQCHAG